MIEETAESARILIVDDEEGNVRLLERLLSQAGYERCTSVTDPRGFWSAYASAEPDLVLLDLHMPHVDGFEILAELRAMSDDDSYLPVLVLTADVSAGTRGRALKLGARDFVTKPFDATEVLLRVRNLLHTRSLTLRLREQNRTLENRVRDRTHALESAHIETVERLALAAEYRDDETGDHIRSVGLIAGRIALELGLDPDLADLVRHAAMLHDIGKIGLPDSILAKPSRLTDEEVTVMRTHAMLGSQILADARTPLLEVARQVALTHHERWDGAGYPNRLRGDAIPLPGRITSVADVFDALTRARRYKAAWPPQASFDEIARCSGSQFDPDVVAAFLRIARAGELQEAVEARPVAEQDGEREASSLADAMH